MEYFCINQLNYHRNNYNFNRRYIFSKENALILDMGAKNTQCTPLHEGVALNKGNL